MFFQFLTMFQFIFLFNMSRTSFRLSVLSPSRSQYTLLFLPCQGFFPSGAPYFQIKSRSGAKRFAICQRVCYNYQEPFAVNAAGREFARGDALYDGNLARYPPQAHR